MELCHRVRGSKVWDLAPELQNCKLFFCLLASLYVSLPVADLENFGGGDFKHKTSKIRMSSPRLRMIFRPKSQIQRFFSPKIRWSPKKKKKRKKVFADFETEFSAEISNSKVFFSQNQVVSKKNK